MISKKNTNLLWNIFLLLFGIGMILILILCIMKTENHLPIDKMIILPTIFVGFFSTLYFWRIKINQKNDLEGILQKITPVALPVFIVLYGIALYVIAIYGRCNPVNDQNAVYQGALYLAGLADDISWEYFARCNNNVMPTVILSVIFRVGSLGGNVDPYYFAVLLDVIQVMLAMYCLFQLGNRRNKLFSAWMGMLMLAMYFFPIASHTLSFYTDAMSFSLGITGFYLWEKNGHGEKRQEDFVQGKDKEKDKTKCFIQTLFIGMLFGLAAIIKITAMIPLIAMLGYNIIKKDKKSFGRLLCVLALSIVFFAMCNYATTFLPSESLRDAYGTPKLSYWIGIGLKGNGGYIDNQDYAAQLNTIYGMEEKSAWSNEYIMENLHEFWNKDHIVSKLRYNFANGDLGGGVFVQTAASDNLFFKLMHYNGEYFWRYTMVMTGLMYAAYACIIIGICVNFIKKQEPDSIYVVALLSVFGIMVYVMLFEANHRQLYNHLPWFILAAECGLADLWNKMIQRRK